MLYARIKTGTCPDYLTEGKWYEIRRIEGYEANIIGRGFTIYDDEGDSSYLCENFCSHLCNGSWEIKEFETDPNKQEHEPVPDKE